MSRKKNLPFFEKLKVIDAGAKGVGVAKTPDGRVVFIKNAIPDDVIDVQIFKKRKSYLEGNAVNFHTYSLKRTEPICQHFGICGGCKWQHMKYEYQLFYKQKEVENNLIRIGNLELPEINTILGCKKQYFYRNKMEFSFSDSRWLTNEEINSTDKYINRNACGFHLPKMWDKILDIKKCYLQEDPSNKIRNCIKDFAVKNNISFFSPRNKTGLLRTLMIRISSTGEFMVVIQFFKEDKEKRELLLNYIVKTFPKITSLQYIINEKGNDSIYDQDVITFYGNNFILEQMENLKFKINAKSFYQTNSTQALELYRVIKKFANLKGNEIVYDLYTGTGTIGQFIAKEAKKVIGVESVPEAVEDAKVNAINNNLANIEFFVGDMKNVFNDTFIKNNGKPDVIITDPPRDGMHKNVVAKILEIEPKKIIYVSCNSATQARDLSLMKDVYKITKIQPVDIFPQTHHVENVVLLELI